MKIPSSFRLMAHTIKVQQIPHEKWKRTDCVGCYDYEKQKIQVKGNSGTMPLHIFLHELTHSILSAMGHKLNNDEAFVDQFSGLLHQALTTAKYKKEDE